MGLLMEQPDFRVKSAQQQKTCQGRARGLARPREVALAMPMASALPCCRDAGGSQQNLRTESGAESPHPLASAWAPGRARSGPAQARGVTWKNKTCFCSRYGLCNKRNCLLMVLPIQTNLGVLRLDHTAKKSCLRALLCLMDRSTMSTELSSAWSCPSGSQGVHRAGLSPRRGSNLPDDSLSRNHSQISAWKPSLHSQQGNKEHRGAGKVNRPSPDSSLHPSPAEEGWLGHKK